MKSGSVFEVESITVLNQRNFKGREMMIRRKSKNALNVNPRPLNYENFRSKFSSFSLTLITSPSTKDSIL